MTELPNSQKSPAIFMGQEFYKLLVKLMEAQAVALVGKDIESQLDIVSQFYLWTHPYMGEDTRKKVRKEILAMNVITVNNLRILKKRNMDTFETQILLKNRLFAVQEEIFFTLKDMILKTSSDNILDLDKLDEEMD